MKTTTVIILALGISATAAAPGLASTPAKWAELMQQASAACVKASGLKKAKGGAPVVFSDKVLVTVNGIWPQPHMKNAPAHFACLYDIRNRTAEANEAAQ
jgi:hypothetical protein